MLPEETAKWHVYKTANQPTIKEMDDVNKQDAVLRLEAKRLGIEGFGITMLFMLQHFSKIVTYPLED